MMVQQPGRIVLMLRAVLFYAGMLASTLCVGPLVLLVRPLGQAQSYRLSRLWTGFNIWWLRKTCGVDYQVSGWENLPDEPVIVLAKHQSTWETLFLQWRLPPVAWVLKRELLWLPVFGWALALLNPIAINRKASSEAIAQIIEQGQRYLASGRWVLVFPEGTRSAPGQRGRYKLGGARLAAHTGYPVLPIAHNAGEFWRRRSFIKYPGTVQVIIGPVMQTKGMTAQQINRQVEAWIEQTMERIGGNGRITGNVSRETSPSENSSP